MRIDEVLNIPENPNLDRFITKLDDDEATLRRNLREFVVTDRVKEGLDAVLSEAGVRLQGNKDIGRFIYGSFGSGKSHLMTVIAKMLERDEGVYVEGHQALRVLRNDHPWLDSRRALVVRLNMMGKSSLVHALYDAYRDALPADIPSPNFTDHEVVFALFEKDAERLGGLNKALADVVDSGCLDGVDGFPAGLDAATLQALYPAWRNGPSRDKRLALAAVLDTWRNHGARRVRPDDLWVAPDQGFERIAKHAQDHGYDTVVWLIDELVIWLRGQTGDTYVNQINTLSSMVDHDSPRVLPFFVLVAVQTDIAETCPTDLSESGFRDHIRFIANRFAPALVLEEQDLYQVCSQRVLALRDDLTLDQRKAYSAAIDRAFRDNDQLVRELAGGLNPDDVRALYPFHPATLRLLVDITQALSRNRTAIAALYGMLDQNRGLKVGDFLPLPALWELLFTRQHVQELRNNAKSEIAQRLAATVATWERMAGKVAAVTRDDKTPEDVAETKAQTELRQIVRTALLCQLSEKPYFPDGRALRDVVRASVLYAFAQADLGGVMQVTGRSKVVRQLKLLAQFSTEVTLTTDDDPRVDIRTRNLDVDKVLAQAKAKVAHHHRFAYVRELLRDVLGLPIGDKNDGRLKITWRGTDRTGRVVVNNVRTMSYAGAKSEFDPEDGAFLVAIDYPFDETTGCTRQDDLRTAERARERQTQWTVCWLPDHFTPSEMSALDDAAAVALIRGDRRTWFSGYASADEQEMSSALLGMQQTRRGMLEDAVRRVYFTEGVVFGMKASLENVTLPSGDRTRALESLGMQILDRRWPNHPAFGRRTGAGELTEVADWTIRAAMKNEPTEVPRAQVGLVDAVAVPLQLVYANGGIITPRRDGPWLSAVLKWASERSGFDAKELRDLLSADDGWQFGFTKDLSDFFLFWLLQAEGYEAQDGGRSVTVQGLRQLPDRFRLVKDEVVDAPTWDRARTVASALLEVKGRSELPSSPEQAKLSRDAVAKALQLLSSVKDLISGLDSLLQLAGIGVHESDRRKEATRLKDALAGIGAELGNAAAVRHLASLGADQGTLDVLVKLRRALPQELAAISTIGTAKAAFTTTETHGTDSEKQAVVLSLRTRLKDSVSTSLLADHADLWATRATDVLATILKRITVVTPPKPPKATLVKTSDPEFRALFPKGRVAEVGNLRASEILSDLGAEVRDVLESYGEQRVRVLVIVEPVDDGQSA